MCGKSLFTNPVTDGSDGLLFEVILVYETNNSMTNTVNCALVVHTYTQPQCTVCLRVQFIAMVCNQALKKNNKNHVIKQQQ